MGCPFYSITELCLQQLTSLYSAVSSPVNTGNSNCFLPGQSLELKEIRPVLHNSFVAFG